MPSNKRPRIIVLVGFMGAGKTSSGMAAAKSLGIEFLDLDAVIEASEQCRVSEIFASRGEAAFRECEYRELARLLNRRKPLVLALGGGAYVNPANADMIHRAGTLVIFLDANFEELKTRVQRSTSVRPLAIDAERFAALYSERRSSYERANIRIDTSGRSAEDVANEIAALVKKHLGNRRIM